MSDKEKLILNRIESDYGLSEYSRILLNKNEIGKLPWYFAMGFVLFWALLFYAVVIPLFYRLPTPLTIEDDNQNAFIAERAYKNLYTISNIGTKTIGSQNNEVATVNFILEELNQIKNDSLKEYVDMEIDLSQVTGQFIYLNYIIYYHGVQNIAVKLSPTNSTSQNYLLINSHFDSKPETSSAGDAGFMIVTMLEVLRVMATGKQAFEHPIVFLFNGAEESSMLASHGFITQHKWAKYCKAVVNLDAAGTGGRELLFQTGPQHSWLVKYYSKYAKHPFGTSLAEEVYQSGFIPSDSDFTIFKNYIPGLDFGQIINGYVYHTKYDLIDVIPRGALQHTGDNVLSIVRGLANASELREIKAFEDLANGTTSGEAKAQGTDNAVFFDFLGLCFIQYSELLGMYLNYGIAGVTCIIVLISMWRMASVSPISKFSVSCWFILVVIIQLISIILGLALPILVAYTFDKFGLSLTYFSSTWLLVGLYVCPALIGLSLPLCMYYSAQNNEKLPDGYHLQLALHSQAIILSALAIFMTYLGMRAPFIFIIPLLFYTISLAFNLLITLHDRGYAWTGLVKVSQVIPFLLISYTFYTFVVVLTPMQGRSGSSGNPDIIISGVTALGTILSFIFLIPLINTFQRPSYVITSLFVITGISIYLASGTQIGFPYRPKTNGLRVAYLHVRNIYHEYDRTLSKDESGYLFLYQDRREEKALQGQVNLTGLVSIRPECEEHMMCGMPLYDFRYVQHRLQSKWLPRSEAITMPGSTTLELINTMNINPKTKRFEFKLSGPSQMDLFFEAYEDATINNWSFLIKYLQEPPPFPLSYHIFINSGIDKSPIHFFVDIKKNNGDFSVPLFQVGVAGHYVGNAGDAQSQKFASSFPKYAILATWPASYERFIF